ncbi:MAG: family 16 glycosylhydrolase [Capsulimonadaceae bacterium]|nr:family 16 glycosylhydrolase [Capsulimonadaceae bacterium]
MKTTWLLQGSVLFESDGYRLLVDPYISDCVEQAQHLTRLAPPPLDAEALKPSAIYCTHDHMDHLDPVGLPEILRHNPDVRVAGPASVRNKFDTLGLDTSRVDVVEIGSRHAYGPFTLTIVKAFHTDPKSTGLLIEAEGLLIYLSGDTEFTDDLPRLILEASGGRAPDYALICINGQLHNMNVAEAAQTARLINATWAAPMHYGLFAENTASPEAFIASCEEAGVRAFAFETGVAKEFPAHVPSLLPQDKSWKLIWSDEFDGDALDRTKWDFRLHLMQQRHNTFTDEGAVLDGKGNLHLNLIEKDGHYYSPHLQTGSNYLDRPGEAYGPHKFRWPVARITKPKFMHKYGYYECRCKLQEQPGWWSAFWLQSPTIGSTLDPARSGIEVDIMENFERNGIVYHNNHWDGYGDDHQSAASGPRKLKDTPDGFHIFGLDWSKEGYVFYIDGEESWRVDGPVSDCEEFVLISTECNGYRDGDTPAPILAKAVLPDAFVVDYVRVFDELK